jgi:hypothetical protein
MPALGVSYNPTDYDPNTRPDPFPAGKYRFMILETDVKATRAGDGSYLAVTHEVQGGPHNGRKFFNQITLANPNLQAQEIGQRQLSALCHTVGYLRPLTDSDVLHGLSGEADIGVEPAGRDPKTGKEFAAKNVVKRYIVPGEAGAAATAEVHQHPATQQQQKAASGGSKRPW